ncbi:calcineurin-like phosphoesterase [Botrytis cinerea]
MVDSSYELDRLTYEPSHHSQDSCTTSSSYEPQNPYLTSSSPEPHIPTITRTTQTRKTRFVCVSDTHNGVANGSFKLPPGDVLIHAGDLTNQGNYAELEKSIKWIEDADFEAKIIIAGNHDITLDPSFYSQYGPYFHKQNPQNTKKCQELLDRSPSILYLNHEAAEVSLASPTGPHTTFRIFGSPFSPAKGMWAFGYPQSDAAKRWDDIPLDVDIVLTHTPPKYHCDERNDRVAAGCEYLRQTLWRVRPRLAVCGHVHEGRGAEIIQWDLGASNIKFKENGVIRWEDPGKDNKKMSHIDLTSKGRIGGNAFKNDGSFGDWGNLTCDSTASTSNLATSTGSGLSLLPEESVKDQKSWHRKNSMATQMAISNVAKSLLAIPEEILSPARGQGGIPPSLRCDVEALCGRMGRQETCVVNAALMASSWPHGKGRGGKKFNKPIVVDIDLPVWEEVES